MINYLSIILLVLNDEYNFITEPEIRYFLNCYFTSTEAILANLIFKRKYGKSILINLFKYIAQKFITKHFVVCCFLLVQSNSCIN